MSIIQNSGLADSMRGGGMDRGIPPPNHAADGQVTDVRDARHFEQLPPESTHRRNTVCSSLIEPNNGRPKWRALFIHIDDRPPLGGKGNARDDISFIAVFIP